MSADPRELLAISRGVRWDFPSSAGNPLRDRADAEPLLARRDDFLAASTTLDPDEATELAANIWRLWIVARDFAGGRAFLATVLDGRRAPRSRWRALALCGDGVFAWWQGEREDARRSETADAFFAESPMAGVAIDDRFELDWLRDQLR